MPASEALAWTDPMELAELPVGAAISFETSAPIRNSGISVTLLKSGFDVEDARYGEGEQDAGDAAGALENWLEHLEEEHGLEDSIVTVRAYRDPDVDPETGEWRDD